jgi:GNAT superfamily N-acetyltransferase
VASYAVILAERGGLTIRRAGRPDVPAIVAMLTQDRIATEREAAVTDPLPADYLDAFAAIDADPNQLLVIGEVDGGPAATCHLTFLPSLTFQGGWRCHVEAVRVADHRRGTGLGRELMGWVIDTARERGCVMVQLMADRRRDDAHRFYESLGFAPTHHGMKLHLRDP